MNKNAGHKKMAGKERNDELEVRAIVKGRVQGVGFRITARNHAIRMGIVGTVRNLPDGSVEIFAQGQRLAIDALMKALRDDFNLGHISAVYMEEVFPPNSYESFNIVYS